MTVAVFQIVPCLHAECCLQLDSTIFKYFKPMYPVHPPHPLTPQCNTISLTPILCRLRLLFSIARHAFLLRSTSTAQLHTDGPTQPAHTSHTRACTVRFFLQSLSTHCALCSQHSGQLSVVPQPTIFTDQAVPYHMIDNRTPTTNHDVHL